MAQALKTPPLRTARLMLTPLKVDDAEEMAVVLESPDLYRFTGGEPLSVDELRLQYGYQVDGPDGDEVWHNWIMRLADSAMAIGFVQATVEGLAADVAWVVTPGWQGRGMATEAAEAMCGWLTSTGVVTLTAHVHPEHAASLAVASRIGLVSTAELDDDGELVWRSSPS
jgi:RimJ/RimL family protein N-acetyltransferase